MDTVTGQLEAARDQLSGGLLDTEIQPRWWHRQPLIVALLRWYFPSRLRLLFDEFRSLPYRIASASTLSSAVVGLSIPAPEAVEALGLREQYLRAGTSSIERLAAGSRWWGPRDAFVACQAFRLGATYGASISGIQK